MKHPRLSLAAAALAAALTPGCGTPGGAPTPRAAPIDGDAKAALTRAARARDPGSPEAVASAVRLVAAGDWRVAYLEGPPPTFRLEAPEGVVERVVPPSRIRFFSEGKRRVILRPEGAGRMAFRFRVPEGMRPVRLRDPADSPLHFPGADVWLARRDQVVTLEWVGPREPAWLGPLACTDSTGAAIATSGGLALPEGWVGVPSGAPTFKVGVDRVYGPYEKIQDGLWTSTVDPYPLTVELIEPLTETIASRLGPAPRDSEHLVVDSCGDCRREDSEDPVMPRGESDPLVRWMRLGTPGVLLDRPGPLQTQTLQRWIGVRDDDPTGVALVNMYAKAFFPIEMPLAGFSFLPPPSFRQPLPDMIASWNRRSPDWEAKTLARDLLPGLLFECREADADAFDAAIRRLAARRRAPRFADLVEALRRDAPAALAPLRVRKLVD